LGDSYKGDWLSGLPGHWRVKRLKFLADVRSGVTKGRDLAGPTVEVPYLRVANVQDGFVDLSDVATIPVGVGEVERFALQPGDVLMNEGGDNDKLGRGAVWRGQIAPCLHQNHVFAVRCHSVDPDWLALVTAAKYAKHYFLRMAKQSTNLASIASSDVKELPVVLPPEDEQKAILRHVGRETAKIDGLMGKVREQRRFLRERRAALVTACVTGAIRVPGAVLASPEAGM
jgi:type I restriction enzyme S subunit